MTDHGFERLTDPSMKSPAGPEPAPDLLPEKADSRPVAATFREAAELDSFRVMLTSDAPVDRARAHDLGEPFDRLADSDTGHPVIEFVVQDVHRSRPVSSAEDDGEQLRIECVPNGGEHSLDLTNVISGQESGDRGIESWTLSLPSEGNPDDVVRVRGNYYADGAFEWTHEYEIEEAKLVFRASQSDRRCPKCGHDPVFVWFGALFCPECEATIGPAADRYGEERKSRWR